MVDVPGLVTAVWWALVVVAIVGVLPVTVYLLHRLWRAARAIERYTAEARAAGLGIAGHTAAVEALGQTVRLGGELSAAAGSLQQHAAALESALADRA